ncbi:hypothetical protein RB595_010250 [Gaeumannomyces hyphopodioides]
MESLKRNRSPGAEDSPRPGPTKKQRPARTADAGQTEIDQTYGQRYVFSNFDGPTAPSSDEEFEVEDEADALAYLRSVRHEAGGIPHLLVAPKAGPQLPPSLPQDGLDYDDDGPCDRSIYTNGVGDYRGYYHDGAYTAVPDAQLSPHRDNDDDGDGRGSPSEDDIRQEQARQAFYDAITTRFEALRVVVRSEPPDEALLALDDDAHGFEVGHFGSGERGRKAHAVWRARLRDTDPSPVQVAAMDRAGALRLLRVLLSGGFLKRGRELAERTSRWLWALLARLPDAGELGHIEVAAVRELGKRAVSMMASLAHMSALREAVEMDDSGDEDEGGDFRREEEGEGDACGSPSDVEDSHKTSGGPGSAGPDGAPSEAAAAVVSQNAQLEEGEVADEAEPQDKDGDSDDQPMELEDGEADDGQPMDLEDGEIDEGQVPDGTSPDVKTAESDLEAARRRLLCQLDEGEAAPVNLEPELGPSPDELEEARILRARMNMRATLNMILTVAGEFYGQRDLLEFRDPFRGL